MIAPTPPAIPPLPFSGRIYLCNVGANAAHGYQSPLFDDGSFELLPIPEARDYGDAGLVRLGDLRSFYNPQESLRRFIPKRLWEWPCHFDPEFNSNTYGDDCERAPRAAGLQAVLPGDCVFFIARLARWREGKFTGEAGFHLAGFLEVADILRGAAGPLDAAQLAVYGANAHVRRAQADPQLWNRFWVFKGSPRSRRFRRAVPVTRELASAVFQTAAGEPWQWDGSRSALQVIGSYTRSCRCVIDPAQPGGAERAACLWQDVARWNGDAFPRLIQRRT